MAAIQLLTAVVLNFAQFWQASGQGIQLTMNGTAEMYSNNSIVTRTDIGTDSSALLCITTSPGCCSRVNNQTGWYFPSGKPVPYHGGMWATKPYYRTRNDPDISKDRHSLRSVKLHRNPNGNTTGIFRCDILDGSQNLQSLYIGIYDSDSGGPIVTSLVFNIESRTLYCTSTGGPATYVTWKKAGKVITLNTTYKQTQRITDLVTGTYQTVLSIAPEGTDINDTYSCMVNNTRGFSTAITEITTSQLQLTITTVGAGPVAGQSYTFICAVTFPMGEFNGTLQWVVPESANPINSIDGITVSRTTPYNLTINELHQSQDGKYTCRAANGSNTGSTSTILRVGVPSISLMIMSAGTSAAGQNYSLNCSVIGAEILKPNITYCWYNESSNPRNRLVTNETLTLLHLQEYYTGNYTCEMNLSSTYLRENLIRKAMKKVLVQNPLTVAAPRLSPSGSFTAGQTYTLNCTANVHGGENLSTTTTITWTQPSGNVTSGTGSSLPLSVKPLRVSDAGNYTCTTSVSSPFLTGLHNSSGTLIVNVTDPLTVAAPRFSPSGSFTAGQTYTLNCIANVHGGENLSTTTTITWTQPSGNVTSGTGSSLSLSLKPLRVSDAGNYTCTTSVSSPFLTGVHNSSGTLIVNVTCMK